MIFKEVPLSQSLSRRPTADKKARRLWVRDWFGNRSLTVRFYCLLIILGARSLSSAHSKEYDAHFQHNSLLNFMQHCTEKNSVFVTEFFRTNGDVTRGKLSLRHVRSSCPCKMSSSVCRPIKPKNVRTYLLGPRPRKVDRALIIQNGGRSRSNTKQPKVGKLQSFIYDTYLM